MFDAKYAREKAKKDFDETMRAIELAESLKVNHVNHANEMGIFASCHLKDVPDCLMEIKNVLGNYTLERYYLNSERTLAVWYKTDKEKIGLYISEDESGSIQDILDYFSGGKCRIESVTEERHTVLCDV